MSLEDLTADDHEVLDDLRKLTPTDMGYIVCRMSPILRDFLISLVDQSSDAARQEGARGGKPVAWSRTDTIRDAEGRGIGMDEPETHYGATPPDDDGGAPWYPMYASPAEPSGWRPIESEKHELDCLRRQVGQLDYPCSPHCAGYLREFAMRNTAVKALRLYTRRTDSGVGAHVIVEIERHDGSTAEIIREFADISDTIIDHWARLPPTSEGGGA